MPNGDDDSYFVHNAQTDDGPPVDGYLDAPPDDRDVDDLPPRPDEPFQNELVDVDSQDQVDEWHPPDDRDVDDLPPPPDDRGNRAGHDREPLSRFHLFTVDEILNLPPPSWLVRDLLEDESFSVLYGAPEGGKSFVALDIAAHISAGTDWQGRKVHPGPVVYVVGEGGRGIVKRLRAWVRANQKPRHLYFVREPAQFRVKPIFDSSRP